MRGAARKKAPFCPPLPLLGRNPERVCASVREPYCLVQEGSSFTKKPDVHVHHNVLDFHLLRDTAGEGLVQPASEEKCLAWLRGEGRSGPSMS